MMDSLCWTNIKTNIVIKPTTKKYFGRYLYKANIFAPCCRLIERNRYGKSIADGIQRRIATFRNDRFSGNWYLLKLEQLEKADAPTLEYIKQIKEQYKDLISLRLEEPYITIYFNDRLLMEKILSGLPDPERIRYICEPKNAESLAVLERGEIIVKKSNGYQYKVSLKEHRKNNKESLQQVWEYLNNLEDLVKMTSSCQHNLTSDGVWFSSCYFYTNDLQVCTFVNLIAPNIISEISKLTVVGQ